MEPPVDRELSEDQPLPMTALIISDMYFQAVGLAYQMEALGWRVSIVPGAEATVSFRDQPPLDLVLLDVDLGLALVTALAAAIRRQDAGLPVGVLVGWWDARSEDAAAVADIVLYKPAHPEQVRQTLLRWEERELPAARSVLHLAHEPLNIA